MFLPSILSSSNLSMFVLQASPHSRTKDHRVDVSLESQQKRYPSKLLLSSSLGWLEMHFKIACLVSIEMLQYLLKKLFSGIINACCSPRAYVILG
jgi:hypothetical protein